MLKYGNGKKLLSQKKRIGSVYNVIHSFEQAKDFFDVITAMDICTTNIYCTKWAQRRYGAKTIERLQKRL